jgi:hypothetical protein
MNWMVNVLYNEEKRKPYRLLVGKPEGKTPLGNGRKINFYLEEIIWHDVECVHLVRVRNKWRAVVSTIMNFRVP